MGQRISYPLIPHFYLHFSLVQFCNLRVNNYPSLTFEGIHKLDFFIIFVEIDLHKFRSSL
jgi:hypothetical protein